MSKKEEVIDVSMQNASIYMKLKEAKQIIYCLGTWEFDYKEEHGIDKSKIQNKV